MTLRILPPGAIRAGVHRTFTDASLAELVANAPADEEMGEAEFVFELGFAHTGSRLTSVDLTVRLRIGMPEWPNADRRPQAERDEWTRFMGALRAHEEGHIAIFRREAPDTYARLQHASAATINDVLAAEEQRIRRLSDAYDHSTDHGRTQRTPQGTTVILVPATP